MQAVKNPSKFDELKTIILHSNSGNLSLGSLRNPSCGLKQWI